MAVNPHDPRPQAQIYTTGGVNRVAPRGAYVDQNLVTRNNVGQVSTAVDPTDIAKGVKLGGTRIYDNARVPNYKPDNPPSAVPDSPNSWVNGRDYYKNSGMTGQDFFDNP